MATVGKVTANSTAAIVVSRRCFICLQLSTLHPSCSEHPSVFESISYPVTPNVVQFGHTICKKNKAFNSCRLNQPKLGAMIVDRILFKANTLIGLVATYMGLTSP